MSSAIDKIADENIHSPEFDPEDDNQGQYVNSLQDDVPKKKSNYLVMLIPAGFILGILAFGYFKMSKPVSQEISNVPVAPLPEKKPEPLPVAPSAPTVSVSMEAPSASAPESVTQPVAPAQSEVASADALQPRLIPNPQNQHQPIPDVKNQNGVQQPPVQNAPGNNVVAQPQSSNVSGANITQPQIVNGSIVVPPTMIPPKVSHDQSQAPMQVAANSGAFFFDKNMSNDQLRSEIDRRRLEIISLVKEAKSRGLVVPPPVCSGAPVKQATLSGASDAPKQSKTINKPAVPVGESIVSSSVSRAKNVSGSGVRSDYFVYAIVDGRAWITSSAEKNNVTVAVGEQLPDGSIVQSVNAKDSKLEVKTSKGLILADSNRTPGR